WHEELLITAVPEPIVIEGNLPISIIVHAPVYRPGRLAEGGAQEGTVGAIDIPVVIEVAAERVEPDEERVMVSRPKSVRSIQRGPLVGGLEDGRGPLQVVVERYGLIGIDVPLGHPGR